MLKTNHCQAGQILPGGYVVKQALGQGGYGYVCYAEKDQQDYAVKVQPANLSGYIEASLLNALDHPNIIKPVEIILLESDQLANSTGATFYIYQPRGTDLPAGADLLVVIYKLLSALAYLEVNGVIHCDLKPDNIVFIASQPLLIDFNAAELCPGSQRVEPYREFDGSNDRLLNQTSWYRAPEMWRQQDYDAGIDVFSLGCCLYRWLSGKPLFYADTIDLFEQQMAQVPSKIAAVVAKLPDHNRAYYQQLLEIMLSSRERRYFASQLITVLTAITTLNLPVITAQPPQWLYAYPLRFKLPDLSRRSQLTRIAELFYTVGITKRARLTLSDAEDTLRSLNNSAWVILTFTLVRQLVNMVALRSQHLTSSEAFIPGGQDRIEAITLARVVSLAAYITTRCDDHDIYHHRSLVAHDLAEFYRYNNYCILPKILLNRHNFVSDQLFLTSLTAKVIPVYYRSISRIEWDNYDENQARELLKTAV